MKGESDEMYEIDWYEIDFNFFSASKFPQIPQRSIEFHTVTQSASCKSEGFVSHKLYARNLEVVAELSSVEAWKHIVIKTKI